MARKPSPKPSPRVRRDFRKNPELEAQIRLVNGWLKDAESRAVRGFGRNRHPAVFIVGCPRSGSTLTLQWLAATGEFAYPTNFVSRFPEAPYLGAQIQKLLTDPRHSFMNETDDLSGSLTFESRIGKTRGALAPHEFWYFWRRFFDFGEIPLLDGAALRRARVKELQRELAALESVWDRPLVMKAMILNWNIPFLARIVPNSVFLHVRRDPFFNAQSVLEARKSYFGSTRNWYSFKPAEYPSLEKLDPPAQVAGQIFYMDRAVREGLSAIPEERRLELAYEDLCRDPAGQYARLADRMKRLGRTLGRYRGPAGFKVSDTVRLSGADRKKVLRAYELFSKTSAR